MTAMPLMAVMDISKIFYGSAHIALVAAFVPELNLGMIDGQGCGSDHLISA